MHDYKMEYLFNNIPDPDANALFNHEGNAFTDALIAAMESEKHYYSNKIKVMNEKNYDFLKDQVLKTGFGENHNEELRVKLQSGAKEFVIGHNSEYDKDSVAATLQFRKSENTEMYFFNSFTLHLKNQQHAEPIKQTFYTDDRFTLKEGYNLLAGRAVLNEKENKEGQKYTAWFQLDFKQNEKNGNYKMHAYHSNYGYELDKALEKHPIKQLDDPTQREYLLKALQRGNRQEVMLAAGGQEKKVFVEASPQYKSLNFYDETGSRLKTGQLLENKAGQQQGEKNNQSKAETQKTNNEKKMTADNGEGQSSHGEKKTRRKGQSIS